MRDFVPRMKLVNPGRVDYLPEGWNNPQAVIARALELLGGKAQIDSPYFVAQHGEDRWMAEHWDEIGLPEQGTFVEVGAADGKHLSNTYWLAKARGWTGLLIEPDPRSHMKLVENRPESNIEIVAAGRRAAGIAKFYLADEPELSGFLRDDGTPIAVTVETLSTLLERHSMERVDVLSIDVEGQELGVWAGLDLSRWRPALVIIEWDTVGINSEKGPICRQLESDGYSLVAELGGNLLFCDKGAA